MPKKKKKKNCTQRAKPLTFQLLRMDSDDSVSDMGTLSSLIQVKLANHDTCVQWEPEKSLLKSGCFSV